MSCVRVHISRIGRALKAIYTKLFGSVVTFRRLGGAQVVYQRLDTMHASISLVCSVGIGGQYEYLACSDLGYIRTFDRGYIIVKK